MARVEYLNVSGLRSDGRRAGEVRALAASCSVLPHTDGSALLECGGTKVLAIVSGPHEASKRATVKDAEAASINVEYRYVGGSEATAGRLGAHVQAAFCCVRSQL
ncbi:hypothetical protein EON67_02750 [archaeon]|nr:MAG: hypothetical protein EON67_02750 [archaeon]